MNLHAIAAPLAGVVNPNISGALLRNIGYTTSAAGKREAAYDAPVTMLMQVQALSGPELELIESLNIQGVKRAIHLPGDVKGIDRASGTGGDRIEFPDIPAVPESLRGTAWAVAMVMETWDSSGWCRVAAVKQL